ncbi:serine hydrolase domain-containing protein [Paenibacillus lactis]|uniref:CubicO group peptidase (Beta-lactamase class C family) n=1 Tax=Paenibacillus lactis TaxID=228574 RepID=A0ABS4FJE2_9BACL|nr:serine hydrolase domain-containing protein [Paenibacillus lactis]MBP1896379.1 CubicO group peptidase (beta-lactamase class C family) [Paenibacillus lactis]
MNRNEGAERLGLDMNGLQAACAAVNRAIDAGIMPGAVLGVLHRGETWFYAAGFADPDPKQGEPAAVHKDTLYDCASITKVAVTLPLILQLVDEGRITLSTKAADIVPAFGASGKMAITVGELLTHTSGLAADMNLHSHGWSREQMWDAVLTSSLSSEPGKSVVYSDLGYLTLGRIAEELLQMPLDQAVRQRVFEPLGMLDSTLTPSLEQLGRYAATEYDEEFQGHLCGVVHDEKARALGGVCGHTGLFATAGDLLRYVHMWLLEGAVPAPSGQTDEGAAAAGASSSARIQSPAARASSPARILSLAAARTAIKPHTAAIPGANRGLGWVLKGDRMDASGDWMSERAYGHTGFTGTSLWIDPAYDLAVVLLTNRVYGGRSSSVKELRVQVHNAITGAVRDPN